MVVCSFLEPNLIVASQAFWSQAWKNISGDAAETAQTIQKGLKVRHIMAHDTLEGCIYQCLKKYGYVKDEQPSMMTLFLM